MAVTRESLEPKPSKNVQGLIDPNVSIPDSVKAASARADAAFKAAYPDAAPDPSLANQEAAPNAQGDESQAGASAPDPSASSEAPATSPDSQGGPQLDGEPPDWEHRYTSMRGRYDRAQNDIRQMADQITNLQNVLATVSAPPDTKHVPHELRAESLLTAEEVNDYGAEFLDIVGKKAREATSSQVQALQNEIQGLKQQLGYVGGSIAQNARESMFATLDQYVPAWRDINNDPRFLQWLALPDPYSGAIKHNLLKAAWERNDTPRAAAFFQGFLAEEAAVDPSRGQPNGSISPQNTAGHTNGRVPLESFAAPGRAKSAAELPAEKPLIKRSQISSFYADCAAGRYNGREADRARREKEIFAAQADGRIIS
jgi:hypothetical protein